MKNQYMPHKYEGGFRGQMCVGCGPYDDVCPQYICLSTAVNKVTQFLNSKDRGISNEKSICAS